MLDPFLRPLIGLTEYGNPAIIPLKKRLPLKIGGCRRRTVVDHRQHHPKEKGGQHANKANEKQLRFYART